MFSPSASFLRLVLVFLALATLSARAFDSVVVINELQYHPANESAETEWVELRSLHGVDVNLSNWSLAGEIEFTFSEGTVLPGGGYLVVAKTPGQIPGSIGPFEGQLNNSGGTLRLLNQNGRIMDEVEYSDGGDWPSGADGSGATLARRGASAESGPEAWTASTELNGTPGGLNFYQGAVPVRTSVVSIGDVWKYDDSGTVAPAGWQGVAFDDSAWKSGPTLITEVAASSTVARSRAPSPAGCSPIGISTRLAGRWRTTQSQDNPMERWQTERALSLIRCGAVWRISMA